METMNDLFRRLEQLNEIGYALSYERDLSRLLEKILMAAKDITRADGGTLYRMVEGEDALRFEIVRNDTLKVALGGPSGAPISEKFKDLPLHTADGKPNNSMVAAYAALNAKTVNIEDAYAAEGFDFSGTRKFDQSTGYRSRSFLTVPMKNHENEIIGVLQLINAIDEVTGEVGPFTDADQRLAESLASQAAVALTNRQLIEQLETLFESFIKMINMAIDEKSPYTGGHCARVPELTMLLAEAVNDTREGPLSNFSMSDKDRYELKIAGLLHDCGKVTTPVHVVDKATKLQTIYDRIHTVDTRFEVLKRDVEIAQLKRRIEALERGERWEAPVEQQQFREQLRKLDDDRNFLRASNIGGEKMSDDDIARVGRIAEYRWTDVAGHEARFLTDDELENLTIRAGTLTQKEREIINYHIVATIKMLESLPWPKHLKNVPEYAGGHHERMDGKGYPKGLKRDEMSVQARIMGIADIFEALTAKDRPYKPGMKLSQALSILRNFRDNGHIDPDLFEVFVRRQVYLRYANGCLDSSQIDAVDEAAVLKAAVFKA
jgi:HD-GYP domain-containing protein (c-di-GMP phosphodiesterase class II)